MSKKEWQAARQVITAIEAAGYEAVIVGGAVRDLYLNKPGNDVDVATSALPEEVKTIFSHTIDVGIEHGTILVLDAKEPVEVTTYRTESTYSDHRRPDAVKFVRSLEEDLLRRDFTMNAMALNASDELIDLYGGQKDIDARIIRAVGNAEERFQEDALRMLRAVRFCSQLGFTIEQHTLTAIGKQAHTIEHIAVERIQVELSKLWCGPYVEKGVQMLCMSGLANYLPGNFDTSSWQHVKSNERLYGWAYFCLLNNDLDAVLLQQYKCSNKDKSFVKSTLQAHATIQQWTAWDYFSYDVAVLRAAYQIAQWQGQTMTLSIDAIEQQKNSLPIQQKSQLAISGQQLMEWTNRMRGPWIKRALDEALRAVVDGKINNDAVQLKDWFTNEFNDER